jgi:hypothetical protein
MKMLNFIRNYNSVHVNLFKPFAIVIRFFEPSFTEADSPFFVFVSTAKTRLFANSSLFTSADIRSALLNTFATCLNVLFGFVGFS